MAHRMCCNKVVLRYIAIALFIVVASYNLVLLLLKTNIKKDDVLLHQTEALIQQNIQEKTFTKLQTDTLEDKIIIEIDKKKIVLSDVAAKIITTGTYVDWFRDVCIWKTMYNLKWHPLYPNITFQSTITKSLSDPSLIQEGYARRARGYIITNITSSFDLLVRSRDGIELTILATGVTLNNVEQLTTENVKYKELLHVSIDEDDIKKQEETARHCYLFKKESRLILNKLEVYYFEILQGAQSYGEMSIEWRSDHNDDFKVIDENNLFRLKPVYHSKIKYPVFKRNDRPVFRYIPNIDEQRRLDFPNIPKLNSDIADIKDKCEKFGRQAKSLSYRYEGLGNIDNFLVYPKEHYEFTSGAKEETLVFNKDQASNIVMKTFAKLKDVQENLEFLNVVHVQRNIYQGNREVPRWEDKLYFVEFDVKLNDQKYRYTSYVQLNEITKEICLLNDFDWWKNKTVHLITPIRNQAAWLKHLLHNVAEIMKKTNDKNVKIHIIDYDSNDESVESILEQYSVPYKYTNMISKIFNKVKGINQALLSVPEDEIAFILDLHLELPLNIFDRIRKFTIYGKTAYCPTLLKLACGEHEQYTNLHGSIWMDIGYGMMAMYGKDWKKVGGMNEKEFGAKWGGEDWELVDRIVSNGLYLIHIRLPRFYHIHHSNQGLWDGRKYS